MQLLVAAVGDARVTLLDPRTGAVVMGRYVARANAKNNHAPLPDGEAVNDHPHYRRAIARGDLTLIREVSL